MPAVNLRLAVNNMTKPQNQLFCRLDDLTPTAREQLRLTTLSKLGLLVSEAVPIFEEATQKAAAFSDTPICILGLAVKNELWFKSAVGLSTVGLMNQIATKRRIALDESFSTYVVDSQQPLFIGNTLSNAVFANSILAQHCGMRAYLGVPLISFDGLCIGTLEVMDWKEREFNQRDIEHLSLLARWCLGEFERDRVITGNRDLSKTTLQKPGWSQANNLILADHNQPNLTDGASLAVKPVEVNRNNLNELESTESNSIKVKLLSQLTEELKTPLTSVIGMASVLHREVYGPLTVKQREYLEIIHDSGQNLISLVDEIVNLGILNEQGSEMNKTAVDIEMLCQQVINSLLETAKQHQQALTLSIEPGNRIWSLDKEKIRQALYYLINSILEMSEAGGEVKVHVSKRNQTLNIAVWISHPWLGEAFGEASLQSQAINKALNLNQNQAQNNQTPNVGENNFALSNNKLLTPAALMMILNEGKTIDKNTNKVPRDLLGLLFCCHLTELHEGRVVVQGSMNSGYRYVLQFDKAQLAEEHSSSQVSINSLST